MWGRGGFNWNQLHARIFPPTKDKFHKKVTCTATIIKSCLAFNDVIISKRPIIYVHRMEKSQQESGSIADVLVFLNLRMPKRVHA